MYFYHGNFSGNYLAFEFRYADTGRHYGDALRAAPPTEKSIIIPEKDVKSWMERWNFTDPSYAEYVLSLCYACDRLMKRHFTVFHGVSFLWNGRAYLFTGPSGTGKTTQARLWKSLFPGEVEILNGDKPILEAGTEGNILVHPSPWKGKEGYGRDDITAPLAGIILLRQAKRNSIRRLWPAEAAQNLFGRICSTFNTEDEILNAAEILNSILRSVPVWLLENRGDEESARMTRRELLSEE